MPARHILSTSIVQLSISSTNRPFLPPKNTSFFCIHEFMFIFLHKNCIYPRGKKKVKIMIICCKTSNFVLYKMKNFN